MLRYLMRYVPTLAYLLIVTGFWGLAPRFANAQTVLVYWDLDKELETLPLRKAVMDAFGVEESFSVSTIAPIAPSAQEVGAPKSFQTVLEEALQKLNHLLVNRPSEKRQPRLVLLINAHGGPEGTFVSSERVDGQMKIIREFTHSDLIQKIEEAVGKTPTEMQRDLSFVHILHSCYSGACTSVLQRSKFKDQLLQKGGYFFLPTSDSLAGYFETNRLRIALDATSHFYPSDPLERGLLPLYGAVQRQPAAIWTNQHHAEGLDLTNLEAKILATTTDPSSAAQAVETYLTTRKSNPIVVRQWLESSRAREAPIELRMEAHDRLIPDKIEDYTQDDFVLGFKIFGFISSAEWDRVRTLVKIEDPEIRTRQIARYARALQQIIYSKGTTGATRETLLTEISPFLLIPAMEPLKAVIAEAGFCADTFQYGVSEY